MRLIISIKRSPALFALVFQGINGLIQVSAFFFLHGQNYLDLSESLLFGTVLSLVCTFNFENIILRGSFSNSIYLYFIVFWLVGLLGAVFGILQGKLFPYFFVFCCWGVCVRIFLAWAVTARPSLLRLALAALLVGGVCLIGNLNFVIISCFVALPLAALPKSGIESAADSGLWRTIYASFSDFTKYLPHTISGLVIGYLDRYVAINVVGGAGGETYLRIVQVCSWAAFLSYPVIFWLRNDLIKVNSLSCRRGCFLFMVVLCVMLAAVCVILVIMFLLSKVPITTLYPFLIVFTAIVFSQYYQVVSSLNFVQEQFSVINIITLLSGIVSITLAYFLIPLYPTTLSLAIMFLMGWLVQSSLTILSLIRRVGRINF